MTVLISIGLIVLLFLIPFLTGNIYSLVFRKKTLGIIETYLTGMAIMYAALFAVQLLVVKLKFDFADVTKLYHIVFCVFIILGIASLLWKLFKEKSVFMDVLWSKKAMLIYALILVQGILYIALKNPYFEDNALLETARITMNTGTIYEYNAFSMEVAQAGFPLSNKLMLLPVFYAYLCTTFGISTAVLFNFVLPVVTFVSFYLVMCLWVQRLGEKHNVSWQMLLLMLIWIVQVGDGWSHSTAFRILHTGYSGEAIFFGVLFAYALYAIKNKCYLISLVCLVTFPGLVKYDLILDFMKGFPGYWKEGLAYSGMAAVFLIAAIYYVVTHKKFSAHLLNPNLTICLSFSEIWNKVMEKENVRWHKAASGAVLLGLLLMCGNMTVISGATQWRSNLYGAPEEEYELLESLAEAKGEEPVLVMAYDELNRWICRLDFDILPVVGYDLGATKAKWYSYEAYDEAHVKLWETVQYIPPEVEENLAELKEIIPMDYIVLKRITQEDPFRENKDLECVRKTSSYMAYLVDKK